MKILLDTHFLLWALQDSDALSGQARFLIEEPDNEIYYSIVSLWEIQIKHRSHPKEMTLTSKMLEKYCKEAGFHMMPIKSEHIHYLSDLKIPTNTNHKDPFDRMMVCQAAVDGLFFLTRDTRVAQYEEPCIYQI